MNARARELLDELLQMSVEDRALLAAELEVSLDEEGVSVQDVETAFDREIEQRIQDVVEGRAETYDVDEVIAELRARHPRR